MELWSTWQEAARDHLFEKEAKKLFGANYAIRQGQLSCDEIMEAESDEECVIEKILRLREHKGYVEALNDFLLEQKLNQLALKFYSRPNYTSSKCSR